MFSDVKYWLYSVKWQNKFTLGTHLANKDTEYTRQTKSTKSLRTAEIPNRTLIGPDTTRNRYKENSSCEPTVTI